MAKKKSQEPLIGAHMSIAGGTFNAILHAEKQECRCVQLFVKSANQWHAKPLTDEDTERFHAERARTGIGPAVAHSSYLINVASPDEALYEKSRESLLIEYKRCAQLGIERVLLRTNLGRNELCLEGNYIFIDGGSRTPFAAP